MVGDLKGWRIVACVVLLFGAVGCEGRTRGGLTIVDAVVAAPVVEGPAAMYLTIANSGTLADTLVAVRGTDGRSAEIHRQVAGAGLMAQMEPVPLLEIPVDSTVAMRPGGTHLMLDGGGEPLAEGDTIEVELTFRRAGEMTASAVVVGYDELQSRLGEGGSEHH